MIDLLEKELDRPQNQSIASTWITIQTMFYRYMLVLKRHWWVVFLTASLGLAIAGWRAGQLPPSYLSSARMMVSGRINFQEGAVYSEELSNFFGTQAELMRSGEVRSRAADYLTTWRPDLKPVPVSLTVTQQPKTSIFVLQAVASDGAYARAYLDACMDEFVKVKAQMRSLKSESTSGKMTVELAEVEKELGIEEGKLLKFQEENNLGYLKEEGNSAGVYLANLNRQLADLRTENELLKKLSVDQAADRNLAARPDASRGASPQDSTISNFGPMSEYLRARQQLQILQAERDQLSQYMRPKHPDIVRLDEEIARTKRLIETFRQQSQEQLSSRIATIELQITTLESVIGETSKKAVDLSRKLAEHDRLKGNADRLRNLYDRLSTNVRNVGVTSAVDQDVISPLERASEPVSIRPGLMNLLLMGGGVGLAAGLAILFLIERIDDRLSSLGDVQKHFPEKVLGQIIHQSHNAAALELLRPDDARHSFAESFRAIRSAFVYLPDEKARPKSILITSAIPGEGKSTVSANLAIAFALSGAKTLLVDCDLRRGGQHRAFGLNNDAGLSEVLQDRVPWTEVVKPSGWNNLSVITRGGNLQQPAEHLLSPAADRFLKEAYKAYDYIIVDSAPVMVAEDTASLAPKIDAVGVVLRFSVSSARMSRRTIDRLKERRARVLGVILNEITVSMPEYGYYNYGGYYYDEAKT